MAKLKITETVLRDAHQSLLATRMSFFWSFFSSFLMDFSRLLAMSFNWRSCWSISREMFSDRSSLSTRPLTKLK